MNLQKIEDSIEKFGKSAEPFAFCFMIFVLMCVPFLGQLVIGFSVFFLFEKFGYPSIGMVCSFIAVVLSLYLQIYLFSIC